MIDAMLDFTAGKQSLPAAAATLSTNVLDGVTAKKLFEGFSHRAPSLAVQGVVTAGAVTQIQAQLIGADDAALGVNPVILADSGLSPVIANGGLIHIEAPVIGQKVAKRFYGIKFTMVGAAGTADVVGFVGMDPQSNMVAVKAAVP